MIYFWMCVVGAFFYVIFMAKRNLTKLYHGFVFHALNGGRTRSEAINALIDTIGSGDRTKNGRKLIENKLDSAIDLGLVVEMPLFIDGAYTVKLFEKDHDIFYFRDSLLKYKYVIKFLFLIDSNKYRVIDRNLIKSIGI